jgi:phosphatidate cytidylyltransferase
MLLAVLLAIGGSAGDLAASFVKRRYGVKDFGNTLGLMGGLLDRMDSLLGAGWIGYGALLVAQAGG